MSSWGNQLIFLVWSKAFTAFKFTTEIFFSIYEPGVTVPVGKTQFSASFRWGNVPGFINLLSRSVGLEARGTGSSFLYFLPLVVYLLLPHSASSLSFKLYLITSIHVGSYPPAHHFPKTMASPTKCNKALKKKRKPLLSGLADYKMLVWGGWAYYFPLFGTAPDRFRQVWSPKKHERILIIFWEFANLSPNPNDMTGEIVIWKLPANFQETLNVLWESGCC